METIPKLTPEHNSVLTCHMLVNFPIYNSMEERGRRRRQKKRRKTKRRKMKRRRWQQRQLNGKENNRENLKLEKTAKLLENDDLIHVWYLT